MGFRRGPLRVLTVLLLLMVLATPPFGSSADDGPEPADPFGPPEGPIPFPIINVSSSYEEDRFPTVFEDEETLRVIWNKGARDMFVYHVVQREFDGQEWKEGEDWVSVEDTQDQDPVAHEHYSHEGKAIRFNDLIYFAFASDDPSYTNGTDHDIVLRAHDPDTGTWGPIIEVTPKDDFQDREPSLAVFQDRLVIVWRTNDPDKAEGTDEDLVMRTYDGAAFSDIMPISPEEDGYMDAKLDMVVAQGRLAMTWEYNNRTNGVSDWDVLFREWNGTGFTSLPVAVSPDPSRVAKLPRMDTLAGEPFIVWESRPAAGQVGAVGIRGRVMHGNQPGKMLEVTRPGSTSENVQPEVVTAGGKAYILWSSFDDSLTHGADSDIVMVEYDGDKLGDIVEVSHPNDGPEVNEGFVVACVFQDNLYAVWRMMYPVDPSLPLDVPVNEDIVMRRVTVFPVEVEVLLDVNPVIDVEIPLKVTVNTFWGAPLDPKDMGITLTVVRNNNVLPEEVELVRESDGVLIGSFLPDKKGSYSFVVTMESMEVASTSVNVLGTSTADDGSNYYIYYTLGALALFAAALIIGLSRRK